MTALLDDYRAWLRAGNASERTVEERTAAASRLLAMARLADARELLPAHVTRFIAAVPARHSRSTYYQHAAALSRFLTAVDGAPPAFMRGVPRPRQPRGVPRPIATNELAAALVVATTVEGAMLRLAAFAGLRVSEICRVRGEDVADMIFVRGKGGHDQMVPTHPVIAMVAEVMPASGWWFPGRCPDAPIGKVAGWRRMKRPLLAIGSSSTPHQLRHWYGSSLLRGGANVRTVQELLRHASLSSTQIYTEVTADDRRRAIGALSLSA